MLKTDQMKSVTGVIHNIHESVNTFYRGELECSGVECLDSLSLHCNVGFLQAVFLQQIIHLQKMLPKVL